MHVVHFTVLSWIARHILPIPGVSVAVERLCSSMASSSVVSTVLAKELLKAGFGEGLDYLEGVTIH
ncbi:hypothetical protein C8R45DRAFT_849725 [Mycena sanguinolenta]|nr:hypothetical protein C8R45DRAFT_849725 [Mycena sanguinolenta]